VLATGCAIDLHPRAFPAGSAAQTTLGLAGVVLLALDDGVDGGATHYHVLVRSSFARYLAAWLLDAASEYTDPERGA
jgi:sarcosine oxidase subunit gamma